MTPGELQAQLAPIRLPAEFAAFGPRDALVAFLCGLLVSLALRAILAPFFIRSEPPGAAARRRIAALAGSPEPERILGLAALLRSLDPGGESPRPAGLDAALYDPRGRIDPAELERAVLAAARRKGGRG